MDLNEMGKFIAKRRKQKNITQKQLADYLDVHVTTVSKWERCNANSLIGMCMPFLKEGL
ncbi:MAG: helix-turn-helix transcriptional regulator [Bacilli bacterium]|nr:helix-turn-helix transcriptional regulator [Bacilli bacterium]